MSETAAERLSRLLALVPWLRAHDDAIRPFDFAAFVRTVNELRQQHQPPG